MMNPIILLSDQEKPFACKDCSFSTAYKHSLEGHRRSFSGPHHTRKGKTHKCEICEYASERKSNLEKHLRSAKHLLAAGYPTTNIPQVIAQLKQKKVIAQLKPKKVAKQTTGKSVPVMQHCAVCPYSTMSKNHLKVHSRKHTGERPYKCDQLWCNLAFSSPSSLKDHIRCHSGEKLHKCKLCDYSANRKRDMDTHFLGKHTDSRPFGCKTCCFTTTSKTNLIFHVKRQHQCKPHCKCPRRIIG